VEEAVGFLSFRWTEERRGNQLAAIDQPSFREFIFDPKEETMGRRSCLSMGLMGVVILLVLAWTGGLFAQGTSAKEAEFYKGKTVDWIIPYKTGGGYDAWARAMQPFIGKITGATFVIRNIPGAGSLVGTNKLYTSDPNGLTIGILNGPGIMQAQLTNVQGVMYDLLKFTWLGRPTSEQRIICVSPKSKTKTVEAMKQAKEPVKFGAPGLGSSMFMDAALFAEALGIKIDLITGYETSEEVDLAIIRGELDAASGAFSSKIDVVKNGDMIAAAQFGNAKEADLANVPNVMDLPGLTGEGKQLLQLMVALNEVGRPMAAPPGMAPERAKFLEEVIKKTLEDPEFLQIAKKQQMDVMYLSAADLRKEMEKGVNLAPDVKKQLSEILAKYQPKK
jgi:tripartite-type tricarboxylate transporter receptor subunit TctC